MLRKFSAAALAALLLLFGCGSGSSGAQKEKLTITVQDMTAPVITVKKSSVELTVGDSFDITSYYTVSDNMTKKPTVTYSGDTVNTKKAGTYHVTIEAADEAGCKAAAKITVTVKEKAAPTPTPTPTPTPDASSSQNQNTQSSSGSSSSSGSYSSGSSSRAVQPQAQPSQPQTQTRQAPASQSQSNDSQESANIEKQYTQSDGATGQSVFSYDQAGEQACAIEVGKRGGGSCTPVDTDGDGVPNEFAIE